MNNGGSSIGNTKFKPRNGYNPCANERPAYDVAGRINDLINCYAENWLEAAKEIIPQAILVIVLLAIMIIAAYMFLKD